VDFISFVQDCSAFTLPPAIYLSIYLSPLSVSHALPFSLSPCVSSYLSLSLSLPLFLSLSLSLPLSLPLCLSLSLSLPLSVSLSLCVSLSLSHSLSISLYLSLSLSHSFSLSLSISLSLSLSLFSCIILFELFSYRPYTGILPPQTFGCLNGHITSRHHCHGKTGEKQEVIQSASREQSG
jgi:hypothetical protein